MVKWSFKCLIFKMDIIMNKFILVLLVFMFSNFILAEDAKVAVDVAELIKNNTPYAFESICGFKIHNLPFVNSKICTNLSEDFFTNYDELISYTLKKIYSINSEVINHILSYKTVEERYAYILEHHIINLDCNTNIPQHEDCRPVIFGRLQNQINYLLCPNLANKYLILAGKVWSEEFNLKFVQCAAHHYLANQCKDNESLYLITNGYDLVNNNEPTVTAKEICLLTNIYNKILTKIIDRQKNGQYETFEIQSQ